MPIITAEDIEAVKLANPGTHLEKIVHPDIPEAQIIARVPTEAEWRIFRKQLADESTKATASAVLVDSCTVFPDAAGRKALLARYPALVDIFGGEIAAMAGLAGGAKREKL